MEFLDQCLPLKKRKSLHLVAPGLGCDMRDSLVAAHNSSCRVQALILQAGIELRPPALGVQSLSHWTTKEVPAPVTFPRL